jgi:2-dehydro-3-deoxy-D-arabinonate dehydratase
MRLYRTNSALLLEHERQSYVLPETNLDVLLAREDLQEYLRRTIANLPTVAEVPADAPLLPPIVTQEVWAAGVTYFRSRAARMEESKTAGGGDFYDRVYHAERPELFFKSTASRVVGHRGKVAIRSDAKWSVPEPELTLLCSPAGRITGYTIGNDMSSRDIEGENPLYLPQAKVYNRSCALGPCILVRDQPLNSSTSIEIEILRQNTSVFRGATTLANLKRNPQTLVDYLFRDNLFPSGCFLLTGTGIVPPDAFTLQPSDEIRISIEEIGTLTNVVG